MDLFYVDTVTVFNRETSNDVIGKDEWHATVLPGVRLIETQGANVATTGLKDADGARLHIKHDMLPKEYLLPHEWDASDDKDNYFTLRGDRDFFVKGAYEVDESVEDLYSYMKSKYDSVYRIKKVDNYPTLIKHWEVWGS